MTETDAPELADLLGGYFHPDWDLDHDTSDAVLQLWDEETGSAIKLRTLRDLDRVMALVGADLDAFLRSCGTIWMDREGEYGERGFLLHVRAVVRDALPEGSSC